MNNVPPEELLSAYLDGELTAAEQAEVERLLATTPAARQLLDELRALGATLQSLPQQKVGEDLSQRVLRIAERRMLAGDESGEAEAAPPAAVPLGQSLVRRFLAPRTLVWLSLTAAVTVWIVINDRSQQLPQNRHEAKEVALAPSATAPSDEMRAREPGPPASMRAADRSEEAVAEVSKAAAEQPPSNAKDAGVEGERRDALDLRIKAGAAPQNAPPAELTNKKEASSRRVTLEQKPDEAASVLVVHCDISPEAARKGAFDKLLDANGIALEPSGGQIAQAGQPRLSDRMLNRLADESQVKEKQAAAKAAAPNASSPGQVDLVYVEATPAQITATLAGLAAQPDAFRTVSVVPEAEKDSPDAELQELVRQQVPTDEAKRMPNAAGMGGVGQPSPAKAPAPSENLAARAGQETMERSNAVTVNAATTFQARAQRLPSQSVYNQNGQQNNSGAMLQGQQQAAQAVPLDKSQQTAKPAKSRVNASATNQRQAFSFGAQPSLQLRQWNSQAERQRVLFVLRVAGGNQSGLPAAQVPIPHEVNVRPADSAASPAAQPADKAVEQK